MLSIFAQADKATPTPSVWEMIVQGGAMGLLGFCLVYVLPWFLKKLWEDRDKERAERARREELASIEREKDRESRHTVSNEFTKIVSAMHTHFDLVLEKLEDRFDRRLMQAIEQVRLTLKERPGA